MRQAGVVPLRPGEIGVTAEQAAAMGLCQVTGDHEGCVPAGCLCGCHRLDPWPWPCADSTESP